MLADKHKTFKSWQLRYPPQSLSECQFSNRIIADSQFFVSTILKSARKFWREEKNSKNGRQSLEMGTVTENGAQILTK